MRTIHNSAKEELEELRQKNQETIEKLVGVFSNVLQVFVEPPPDTEVIQLCYQVFEPVGGAQQLLNECEGVNAYKGNNYLPLIWRFYKSHRSAFFRLLNALKFESTSQEQTIIEAVKFLQLNANRRTEFFPDTLDLSFASPQWLKLLKVQQGEKNKIVRRPKRSLCILLSRSRT